MGRRHGTYAKYVTDACRCEACRAANAAYEKERKARQAMESWHPERSKYVDGDIVRAHLRQLSAAGMGWKRVAKVSDVPTSTVVGILYGYRPDRPGTREHRPPRKRVHRATAEKLLAVTVGLAPAAVVDGAGTARRLQALVAVGWSCSRLAERLGVLATNFSHTLHGTRGCTHATAQRVRALYDELWDAAPPASTRFERAAATRARNFAARRGWAPPMAWDDDTIDDPGEDVVRVNRPARGTRFELGDVEFLLDAGETLDAIAHRLGVRPDTILARCARNDRHELRARLLATRDPMGHLPNHTGRHAA